MTSRPPQRLTCEECETSADDRAHGWRAYLIDVDDDGQDEPVFYSPTCAQREFGGGCRNVE